MRMHWFLVLALSCACLTLAACGKKGDPYAPDHAESKFPHRYPQASPTTPPDQPSTQALPPGTISPALPVPVGP